MRIVGRGEKVILRHLCADDWQRITEWERDEEIIRFMGGKRLTPPVWVGGAPSFPPAILNMGVLIGRRWVLGIESEEGRFIGYIELRQINWRRKAAELRVCIGEKGYWGLGYGTDAVRSFLLLVFERFKLDYVYLRVYKGNSRAIRCYEKVGFVTEGVLSPSERSGDEEIVLMRINRTWLKREGSGADRSHQSCERAALWQPASQRPHSTGC